MILYANNRTNIDKIRYSGMLLSRNNHNTEKRSIFFNNIINNLINNNIEIHKTMKKKIKNKKITKKIKKY